MDGQARQEALLHIAKSVDDIGAEFAVLNGLMAGPLLGVGSAASEGS